MCAKLSILFLIALNSRFCLCSPHYYQPYLTGYNSIAGIYEISSSGSERFQFLCQGTAVHYRLLLAPSSCVDSESHLSNYIVRVYNWTPKKSTSRISEYNEHDILRVFHYPLTHPAMRSSADDVVFIIVKVREPFTLSFLEMANQKDEVDPKKCLIIHFKHKNNGISLKQYDATVLNKGSLLDLFQKKPEDDFTIMPFITSKTNKLICHDQNGGTLFCQAQQMPGRYLITGVSLYQEKCNSLHMQIRLFEKSISSYTKVIDKYNYDDDFANIPPPTNFWN